MNLRTGSVLVLLLIVFGCSGDVGKDSGSYKLPSGKRLKIVNMEKMDLPESEPILALHYETDIPIKDKASLRKEVDEVWEMFQKDVEKAGLRTGLLRATHHSRGLVPGVNSYNFIFVKRSDGKWHCLEDDKE